METTREHSQAIANARDILAKWRSSTIKHSDKKRQTNMVKPKSYVSLPPPLGLSQLKRVLKLDPVKKTILVEPGITMKELVDATLPFGLIPQVVPEFKGITVGGAINGGALESSSHRFGQFNDTCLSYEIMLGDGSIITASPTQHSDLFYGIAGSYGTLCFLLSAKIKLIPTTGWLGLNYRKFSTAKEAISSLNGGEVMEAIIFSKDKTVVIEGSHISQKEASKMNRYHLSSYNANWFYSRCDQIQKAYHQEAIPISDYLFRHDQGAFWMGGYALDMPLAFNYLIGLNHRASHHTPKNPNWLFRSLFGRLFSSQSLYARLHGRNHEWFEKQFVIQDFYLPEENTTTFIEHVMNRYKITPIWLCPIRSTTTPQLFSPHRRQKEELLFDIGVYGFPNKSNGPQTSRDLEKIAYQLNGKKMLYSHNYITENEFWKLYPEKHYRILREKYHMEAIVPDITQKVLG